METKINDIIECSNKLYDKFLEKVEALLSE